MKSYLLLRDNEQSGPYTLNEIKQKQLQPFDLVWIEGHSQCWNYPTEIKELKTFVKPTVTAPSAPKAVSSTSRATDVASVENTTTTIKPDLHEKTAAIPVYDIYADVSKEMYEGITLPTNRTRRSFVWEGNIMALLMVVIGAAMAAYIVKSIVATFDTETPIASSQATEIQSISYESAHAAMAPAQTPPVQTAALTEEQLQIPEESLPAKPTESEKQQIINESKPVEAAAVKEKPQDGKDVKQDAVAAAPVDQSQSAEPKEEPKEAKKPAKDVRSQVSLSANDYKVGVLGGVSNLQLQVSNSSGSTIDKATVQVDFLKPNGSVVGTETVEARNIQPGGSKSVSVPSSSRGVKVRYRIVDVDAQ